MEIEVGSIIENEVKNRLNTKLELDYRLFGKATEEVVQGAEAQMNLKTNEEARSRTLGNRSRKQ